MFANCYIRTVATATLSRTSRISSACCHTNAKNSNKGQSEEKNRQRGFFMKFKPAQTIEDVPQKESLKTILKTQITKEVPGDFKTVYQFPQIKYFGLVNRLKAYYTVFSVLIPAGNALLCSCGFLSWNSLFTTTTLGICGCLTFYSLGFAAVRFVGFIYYNPANEVVRIAYVDFWGRRRDIEVPLQDIIPKDECPTGVINKLWHPLRRYSTNESLKLQLQQGIIMDQAIMKKILL